MAQHIRNQHIRAQPQQQVRKSPIEYLTNILPKHIGSSPSQSMTGFITVLILLILVLIVVALHFFGVIKVPQMSDLTATPKSHLQYFFF